MKRSPKSPQPDQKNNNGFLNRWSQRKREADIASPVVPNEIIDDTKLPDVAAPQTEPDATKNSISAAVEEGATILGSEAQALTDADMPDLETLNADSDFSPFFSDGVSKELRNLALKKLFFSGKFAARDGLDDYDDDFTYFEPLGDTVTSDMKFHRRRKEKARLAELEAAEKEQEKEQEQEEQLVAEGGPQENSLDDSQADQSVQEESQDSALESTKDHQVDEGSESGNILHADADRDNAELEVAIVEDTQQPLG